MGTLKWANGSQDPIVTCHDSLYHEGLVFAIISYNIMFLCPQLCVSFLAQWMFFPKEKINKKKWPKSAGMDRIPLHFFGDTMTPAVVYRNNDDPRPDVVCSRLHLREYLHMLGKYTPLDIPQQNQHTEMSPFTLSPEHETWKWNGENSLIHMIFQRAVLIITFAYFIWFHFRVLIKERGPTSSYHNQ